MTRTTVTRIVSRVEALERDGSRTKGSRRGRSAPPPNRPSTGSRTSLPGVRFELPYQRRLRQRPHRLLVLRQIYASANDRAFRFRIFRRSTLMASDVARARRSSPAKR